MWCGLLAGVGPVGTISVAPNTSVDAWPLFLGAAIGAIVVCAIAIVIKQWRASRIALWRRRRQCPECGCDVEPAAERCPECGAVQSKAKPAAQAASPSAHMLWSVHFTAGNDALDVPVWRELMSTVDAIYHEQPAGTDLLFAATGTDGDPVVTSHELGHAAECIMGFLESKHLSLPLCDVIAKVAHQARQFARQHPYAHVQRTVTRRAA